MQELLNNQDAIRQIIYSVVIVIALGLVRLAIVRVVDRRVADMAIAYRWRKAISYVATVLGVLALIQVWFTQVGSLTTYLGLLSAGLAIALQSLLVNLAGWVFILSRRPFAVGDRIQVGDMRGDVIDQRAFAFSLLEIGNWVDAEQSTGRIIHVPNGTVFNQPVANYSHDFPYIWVELPVVVTFESDWEAAREILHDIVESETFVDYDRARDMLRRTSRRFMLLYPHLTPIVYLKVADSGVVLTLRFLCEPRQRRSAEQAYWVRILKAFGARDDIDLAYPTRRVFSNVTEGKRRADALARADSASEESS